MDTAGTVGGYLGIIVTVAGVIFAAINHKRLRSNCCGRKVELSFDVENTTPIENPMIVVNGTARTPNTVRAEDCRQEASEAKISVA